MIIPEKPEFLYKYCSAKRATQIIRDLSFYYTPVSQLNDLFEFRIKSLYTEDLESKYRVFAKRIMADGRFSTFEEAFDAAKSMTPGLADETYKIFLEQLNAFLSRVMKHTGVTCFSSERNNQRMWGTYGQNHTGVCIEFRTGIDSSVFASHLNPVIYTNSKIPFCPSELLNNEMKIDLWLASVFCHIKHIHWDGEKEWRLLLLTDQPQSEEDRVIGFERSAIARIYLGPNILESDEAEIRKVAGNLSPEIPVYKREVHNELAQEELVGFEEINSIEQLEEWLNISARSRK